MWEFATGPAGNTSPSNALIGATNRKYTRRLYAADEASITVAGNTDAAAAAVEMISDLWVFRAGVLVGRGRLAPSTDTLTESAHNVNLTAWAYRKLLDFRFTEPTDTLSFNGVDIAQIAWSLINASQGRTGGALGITQSTVGFTAGVGSTGVTAIRNYVPEKQISQLVDQLGDARGFDWDISPTRQLRVWSPSRGAANGVLLQYGGNVRLASRTFAPASFANAGAAVGGAGTVRSPVATAGIGADPRGRWEFRTAYNTATEQATVDQHAAADLVDRSTPSYAWTFTMAPGAWPGFTGTGGIDVGDIVNAAVVSKPRLNVLATVRITEIAVSTPADGDEIVVMKGEQLT